MGTPTVGVASEEAEGVFREEPEPVIDGVEVGEGPVDTVLV